MRSETIVGLADLRFISITCSECKTVVTLDTETGSHLRDTYGFFTPKQCPGCQRNYDSAIPPNVDALWRALVQLKPIAERLSFHGAPAEERRTDADAPSLAAH